MNDTYTGMTLDEAFDALTSAQHAYHMALMTTLEGFDPASVETVTLETVEVQDDKKPKKVKGKTLRSLPEPLDPQPANPHTDANVQKVADVPGQTDKGNGFDPALLHQVPWEVVLEHSKNFMDKNGGEALQVLIKEKYGADRLSQIPEESRAEYLNLLATTEMN